MHADAASASLGARNRGGDVDDVQRPVDRGWEPAVEIADQEPGRPAGPPRPLDRRGIDADDGEPGARRGFHDRLLGLVLRPCVVREKPSGAATTAGCVLRRDVKGRRRRRVDQSGDPGRRRSERDRPRSGHVDVEHRPWIGHAERVHPGGVVDDRASLEAGLERRPVAQVPADWLGADRDQALRGGVGAGQGPHRTAGRDQLLDDRPSEEPGRACHKSPASHGERSLRRRAEQPADGAAGAPQ